MNRDHDVRSDARDEVRDDARERDEIGRQRDPFDVLASQRETPIPSLDSLTGDAREPVAYRGDVYRLRAGDVQVLRAVGTFRAVYADDLRSHHPGLDRDLRTLREQHLIDVTRLQRPDTHETVEVVSLTPAGRDLVQAAEAGDQRYHSDVVRLREVHHDAQLWRMYRRHVEELQARGATVEQVRLDHELKHALWSRTDDETSDAADSAEALGLPRDADGRVQIPDVQLVVREADGTHTRCNLEFVTRHYPSSTIVAKLAAGFRLYDETGPRGPVEDPDRAARLFEF